MGVTVDSVLNDFTAGTIFPMLKQILDILVCPVPECRKALKLSADESSLDCTGCRRIYPIRDGIPILLIDEAKMPQ